MNSGFTGATVAHLTALVDRTLWMRFRYSSIARNDPLEILRRAQEHLTDRRDSILFPVKSRWPEMDLNDTDAYEQLREIATCIETGLTRTCALCHKMEGQHEQWTDICPVQPIRDYPECLISDRFIPQLP
jgi:hypothetical protein